MIEMINDHPGTLPEYILKVLERYWELNLPKDYRNFLLKHNGGESTLQYYSFKEEKGGSDIRFFLGICLERHIDLLDYFKSYKDRILSHMFPIGYDSGGNLILISVKNPDRGKIYFWDHEMEADPNQGEVPDYSNLTLIADDFNEFINKLRE